MRVADIAAAHAEGRARTASFVKTPAQTTGAGIWFDLSMSPGNPVPQYYFATPLAAMPLARSTDGGLDHGQPVPGYTKYLQRLMLQVTTAAAVPLPLQLLDYQLYYPGIAMDTGQQALTNVQTLPRQVSGREGEGVHIMLVEQSGYVGGATLQVTYTNSAGVSGRTTPVVTLNSQTVAGTIATASPTLAGACGRFLPLAPGDAGVRSVDMVEFFVGDVGLLALVLVKPLARTTVYETTAPAELDLLLEYGSLPPIADDAYLNFICKPPGTLAAAPIAGDITVLWSPTS